MDDEDFLLEEYRKLWEEIRKINDLQLQYIRMSFILFVSLFAYASVGIYKFREFKTSAYLGGTIYGVCGEIIIIALSFLFYFGIWQLGYSKKQRIRYWKAIHSIRGYFSKDPIVDPIILSKDLNRPRLFENYNAVIPIVALASLFLLLSIFYFNSFIRSTEVPHIIMTYLFLIPIFSSFLWVHLSAAAIWGYYLNLKIAENISEHITFPLYGLDYKKIMFKSKRFKIPKFKNRHKESCGKRLEWYEVEIDAETIRKLLNGVIHVSIAVTIILSMIYMNIQLTNVSKMKGFTPIISLILNILSPVDISKLIDFRNYGYNFWNDFISSPQKYSSFAILLMILFVVFLVSEYFLYLLKYKILHVSRLHVLKKIEGDEFYYDDEYLDHKKYSIYTELESTDLDKILIISNEPVEFHCEIDNLIEKFKSIMDRIIIYQYKQESSNKEHYILLRNLKQLKDIKKTRFSLQFYKRKNEDDQWLEKKFMINIRSVYYWSRKIPHLFPSIIIVISSIVGLIIVLITH